ncbi:MAG: nucleotidyltransferase family protein [Candidatus Omnitrophica bacterium]|nr:nucleotidyltransferase family protein [Candidatus Omnitrophota bacterium]
MDPKYTDAFIIRDNVLKQREFSAINSAFRAADIPMVPIKGMALLYEEDPYAETRLMCDIDILVRKDDLERSKDILLNSGYNIQKGSYSEDYYRNHYHHIAFYGKHFLELHWSLSVPRPNVLHLPELWDKVRHLNAGKDAVTLLSPEDTIFSLALHLRRFNEPFSLRYIQDIYKILELHGNKLDWGYISKYSGLNRLKSLIYYVLISLKVNLGYRASDETLNMFYPGMLRSNLLKLFVAKINPQNFEKMKKYAYVFLRFLMYDSARDFIRFIIFLPEEEFSRFYSIKFPSRRASVLYGLRFLAAPFLFLIEMSKNSRKTPE